MDSRRLDPSKPLRRCGEWVQEVVAKALAEEVVEKAEVVVGEASIEQTKGT